MTEPNTNEPASPSPGSPAPAPRRRAARGKRRQRAAWTPSTRWVPLPEAAGYLGTTATALRKYVERAPRDENGRVQLQGESVAEKRGRLWFVSFPSSGA